MMVFSIMPYIVTWISSCIDASNPFGHGTLLPRGTLREPLSALQRADAIVLSRVELAPATLPQLCQQIRRWNACPSVPYEHACGDSLSAGSGHLVDSQQLQHHRVVAFAGIGNPQAFAATVAQVAGTVAAVWPFPIIMPIRHRIGRRLSTWPSSATLPVC